MTKTVSMLATIALSACVNMAIVPVATPCVVASPQPQADSVSESTLGEMVRLALADRLAGDQRTSTSDVDVASYVGDRDFDESWLPSLTGVTIHLLTREGTRQADLAGKPYFFFVDPERRSGGYSIGLAYGVLCSYTGRQYHFTAVGTELRLKRVRARFRGDC